MWGGAAAAARRGAAGALITRWRGAVGPPRWPRAGVPGVRGSEGGTGALPARQPQLAALRTLLGRVTRRRDFCRGSRPGSRSSGVRSVLPAPRKAVPGLRKRH